MSAAGDFRTRRYKLPREAFALSDGPDPAPSDLVDAETWRGITNLPDDVSLRTSDHHGEDIRHAYAAWGEWVSLVLSLQYLDGDEPSTDSSLVLASFVSTDELQSSLYSALTGFYRASVGDLRLALEGALTGLHFTVHPNPARLKAWEAGTEQVWMRDVRPALAKSDPCRAFPALMSDEGWVAESLRELNHFSHGKLTTANVELWQGSNGPIYVPEAFNLWKLAYCDTLLLIVLLTALGEPRLASAFYPPDFSLLDFTRRLLDWHPDPPQIARDIAATV